MNVEVLNALAYITGGNFYNLQTRKDIKDAINELLFINRNYYVIRFKPLKQDGKRTITLSYNDNENNKPATTMRQAQVGKNFNLNSLEYSDNSIGANTYYNPQNWNKKKIIVLPQVASLFDYDKYNIRSKFNRSLNKFVEVLKKNPSYVAVILGHTDLKGDSAYCMELSLKRAESVKNHFISNGVDASRLITEAKGKNFPIWNPETAPIHAAENRRVEVMILE